MRSRRPDAAGSTLASILDRHGRLPIAAAVDLMTEVCDAIDSARGPLSPHGVWLHADGSIELREPASPGGFAPAPVYRAPEPRAPEPRAPEPRASDVSGRDDRADVFAVGVMLTELISSSAVLADIERAKDQDDEAALHELLAEIPLPLSAVLFGALAFDAEARYPTIAELRDELHTIAPELGNPTDRRRWLTEATPGPRASASASARRTTLPTLPAFNVGAAGSARGESLDDAAVVEMRLSSSFASPRVNAASPSSRAQTSPRPRWPALAGAAAVALVAGGWSLWSSARHPPASTPPPVAVGSPPPATTRSPAIGVELDVEQAVALVNTKQWDRALDYPQRHELLDDLHRRGAGHRVDEPLQIAMDLIQADHAPRPCEVFANALRQVEGAPVAYFLSSLSIARVPAPGPDESPAACEGHDARLGALRARVSRAARRVGPSDHETP